MKISFLDVKTIGNVPNLVKIKEFGELIVYDITRPHETQDRIRESEVVITNKVVLDETVLKEAHSLKLICVAATGTNNVDLEFCKRNDIIVKNAVNYSTKSVAQATFNSLLFLIHQSNYYDHYVKASNYSKSDTFTHIYHDFWELNGKKFGIIGLGNIGKEVARIAKAFGANVVYYSTSGKNNDPDLTRVSLEELLSTCDVISIHAPLNENTKDLISKEELGLLQSHAILINMGRGGIVNEEALAAKIDGDLIGGAALDVLVSEPIQSNNPLLSVKNRHKLFITPHNAWASIEARTKLIDIICGHLKEYLKD